MCIRGKIFILFLNCFVGVYAQVVDTALKKAPPRTLNVVDAAIDFYTTFNKNNSINSQDVLFRNNLYFYYNFTIQNRTQFKKFRVSNYFFNEYGIRNFKDSIAAVSEDLYNLKNSISIPIRKSKLELNFSVTSKSQFWPHYTYELDSNRRYQKKLYTTYLSPGYTIYSGGLRFSFWDRSSIEIGLASGKTVKIKNQDIFINRSAKKLYGLPAGDLKKTTLGIHAVINIATKKLFKNFYIEQFSQVFIDKDSLQKIKSYNVDVNNAFHYVILKYVRISLRTKFIYDQTVSIKPSIINQLSIGFYLTNKLE